CSALFELAYLALLLPALTSGLPAYDLEWACILHRLSGSWCPDLIPSCPSHIIGGILTHTILNNLTCSIIPLSHFFAALEQRLVIAEAMQEFVTLTCIRFVSRTTEHDYIDIVPGDKCWSYFGRIGGRQHLGLLKPGCIYKGLIQHELNHALGFLHEQTRSDRDDYVKINLEYVAAEQGNFAKVNSTNLGLPYDYSSVMHYGAYDFSNTAGKATIVPVPNASVPIGQRAGCFTFSSDNFPHAYPNNVSCLWLIRIPEKKVRISQSSVDFHVMDLQPSPNCASDYIRVYDGISRNARVLVDNFCEAGTLPAVVASGSMLLVEFVSDEDTSAAGFSASYTHGTHCC
uniref:Metalloendopeptidase n=1 Tax=Varanus komodoensis TaxID=61221 RepID=A0A8D2L5X0_VARKO